MPAGIADTWGLFEEGSLEYGIVLPEAVRTFYVVGRWFPETEGDFRAKYDRIMARIGAARESVPPRRPQPIWRRRPALAAAPSASTRATATGTA